VNRVDDLNAATPLAALASPVTPRELFFVRSHSTPPVIDANGWRLAVRGETELTLSLSDLQTMGVTSHAITMECAGNGRSGMDPQPRGTPWDLGAVATAQFTGVPLRTVLDAAAVGADAAEVVFTGADSGEVEPGRVETYRRSLPVATALDPGVLIAWAMGGSALSAEHGAPARLIVPGWYGMASVKWLTEIAIVSTPFRGYYQDHRYVYDGEGGPANGTPVTMMRVRSLIASPGDGDSVSGAAEITGAAWSGYGAIAAVAISCDGGGTWRDADITPAASPYAAATWRLAWAPQPGTHELVARATDAAGNVQPLHAVWNEHGYGNNAAHRVTVTVTP
jgi:DMSO/TMAO reductase YedYZ molybdopterin-dependent catalytic subunit